MDRLFDLITYNDSNNKIGKRINIICMMLYYGNSLKDKGQLVHIF